MQENAGSAQGTQDEVPTSDVLKANFRRLFHGWIFFQMKLLRDEGLAIPQLFTLRYLYYNRPKDLSSMADFLGVTKPTVTGIVRTLERDGFVRRRHDSRDRRRIDITLTGKSLGLFERLEGMTTFVIDDFLESIPAEAMKNLNETMTHLTERLSEASGKKPEGIRGEK